MIREVSRCPYCGDVSAGVDDDGPELVLTPDRASGQPCPHLVFLIVSLGAYDEKVELDSGHSREWFWSRESGPMRVDDVHRACVVSEVTAIACELLPDDERLNVEYRIGGATALEREELRPGTGEFPLPAARDPRIAGILDGWGLYSESPDDLAREVHRMAGL